MSKRRNQNIWPSKYNKPDLGKLDWSKSDEELANEIIDDPNAPKGPKSEHNLVKKYFNDKRKLRNDK
jgi:hypothetical protein